MHTLRDLHYHVQMKNDESTIPTLIFSSFISLRTLSSLSLFNFLTTALTALISVLAFIKCKGVLLLVSNSVTLHPL